MLRTSLARGFHLQPGPLTSAIQALHQRSMHAAHGLWRHDPAAWSLDPRVQALIANRLGWLASPALMRESLGRLRATADSVRQAGFEDVVLLGMGGSSLAPEVLHAVVDRPQGWPRLHMLDSTDPAAVRSVVTTPARTLYLLASKSGTTIEPNSLAAHFRRTLEDAGIASWASHFIAITDPGTELAERSHSERFREVFINPADIGGRYSALSFFGMVPAALMGQDVAAIIDWGIAMLEVAKSDVPVEQNPAVALGLLMAAGAKAGYDKLTLVVPPRLEPFGLWVEQLVGESTGKQGVGVIPIAGETLGTPGVYGSDRVFVRLRLEGGADETRRDGAMQALQTWPSATITFTEPAALGAEFARWEVATAVAGALLEINPFDEPNVKQAKDATQVLLNHFISTGRMPESTADHVVGDGAHESLPGKRHDGRHGISFTLTAAARSQLHGAQPTSILTLLGTGDYLSLLAYLGPAPELGDVIHRFRMSVRDHTHTATMTGYGPRYLHSTGQLHKGGPNSGVFVLVTAVALADLDIPGQPFSFGTLETAQARGDFASLEASGRRGLHIHLPAPDAKLLDGALHLLLTHLTRA